MTQKAMEMPHSSVLLLGVDRYTIRACEQAGVEAVAVRGPAGQDNGATRLPENMTTILVDDPRSPESVLAGLHRAGLGRHRFDAIHTADEFSLVAAGTLGRVLGVRAPDPETALRFRDKSLQKEALRQAGLPVAQSQVIADIRTLETATTLPFDRAVVKPIAGAGTAMTKALTSAAEARAFALECRRRTSARVFLLEEYVGGRELVVDGLVVDGNVRFFCVGEYEMPCLDLVTTRAALRMFRLDPLAEHSRYDRVEQITCDALRVLGLQDGVFHMELFEDEAGRLTFSECAARRGGALTQEEVTVKFGVSLADAALACALGREPEVCPVIDPSEVGAVYLSGRAGTLIDCPPPAQITKQPAVEFARIAVPLGTVLGETLSSTGEHLGAAVLSAASRSELAARMDDLTKWFAEQMVTVPSGATPRELRNWQAILRPDVDFGDTML